MRLCVCCGGRASFFASSFAALSVPASLLPFSALGFFYDFSVVVCDSLNRERSICFPKSCRFLPFWTFVLYKGGVPAAPSDTATLLRLSPSYLFYP